MDVKWSYYLIIGIYVLVITLRMINHYEAKKFLSKYNDSMRLFAIKRDFFTTISIVCIITTIGINIATMYGNQPLNISSIIITLLVCGFTLLNSFISVFVSPNAEKILLFGYEIGKQEIEQYSVKKKDKYDKYNFNFTKEIDSYNYMKIMIFSDKKQLVEQILNEKK